jgi:hypothetical protein
MNFMTESSFNVRETKSRISALKAKFAKKCLNRKKSKKEFKKDKKERKKEKMFKNQFKELSMNVLFWHGLTLFEM